MFVLPAGKMTQRFQWIKREKESKMTQEKMIAFLRCSGLRRDFDLWPSKQKGVAVNVWA